MGGGYRYRTKETMKGMHTTMQGCSTSSANKNVAKKDVSLGSSVPTCAQQQRPAAWCRACHGDNMVHRYEEKLEFGCLLGLLVGCVCRALVRTAVGVS